MNVADRSRPSPGSTESVGSLGEPLYRFPTTVAQQALWYLDRLEPADTAWNIAVRFRIRGPLDLDLLERSLNEIVRRHEVLRTTFLLHGDSPVQIVHASAHIPLPLEDLSHLSALDRDAEEEVRTICEGSAPFDLKTGPLIRARVLRLAAHDHMLLVTVHHIVSDGWSIGVLSDEIAAHYAAFHSGRPSQLPTLRLQYGDYTVWQNERTSDAQLEAHRSYWAKKLAKLPVCEIPTDHPRPPVKTHNGYILSLLLPKDLTDALVRSGSQHGCTFYITALSALKMLIAHRARQNDIYVGTLVAGRDRVELEPLIGVFINTLVLRTDLSGDPTFPDLLTRVRNTFEEALAHQDLHFQQVVETLRLRRDPSRPTLFGINFIYQRDFVKPAEFAGLTMSPVPSKSPGAIHDLNFFMVQRSDGWRLSCEYNYDLYEATSISRMLGQLRNLFEEIVKNPERRISEFSFPEDAGVPLPNFVPRTQLAAPGASTGPIANSEPRNSVEILGPANTVAQPPTNGTKSSRKP